jgi:hypothetical protein
MSKILLKTFFYSTVLLAFVFSINIVSAQSMPSASNQLAGLEMSVSPESPKPNQDVSISVVSYSINLDSSTIRWYMDDVLKKEGVGVKDFNTRMGKSGDVVNIRAEVFTNDGRNFEQSININPAEVVLIIEASSYVPPLYKGRAYFGNQGIAKIIAMPDIVQNGVKLDAKKLNYKWTMNGIVLGGQSGTGKNTVIIEGSVPIRDITVDLDVIDVSGKIVATESAFINPSNPKILFYEDSSLYGVLSNKAVSANYNIGNKEEVKIVAKPYFFDFSGINTNESKYKWSVNGKTVALRGVKNEILLRQDGKTGGAASVSLKIENQVRIFQYAENNFNITFGN